MPSISYYIVKIVLKIKGIKRSFSQDPIPYKNLRKDDRLVPSKSHQKKNTFNTFKLQESTITEIVPKSNKSANNLIIYCPGGAFVSGPSDVAWDSITYLTQSTGTKAWLVNYPKAPEHQIQTIAKNIYAIYKKALEQYDSSNIVLLGDSAGGNLILTLVQSLIKEKAPLPALLIPICPVMDASMSNPQIATVDPKDIMLSKAGVLSSNKMLAGDVSLTDPTVSPLYGSFKGFPPIHLFIAEYDVLGPDAQLAADKIKSEAVSLEVTLGPAMPHIWPLLPVMKEASIALDAIAKTINRTLKNKL